MSQPSTEKLLKSVRRRNKITKHLNRHPKCNKIVRNQRVDNLRTGQMGRMRKMLDERQAKMDARPFYLKWMDKVVQFFMQKVYRHIHYFKMNLKKRIAFLKGYKVK